MTITVAPEEPTHRAYSDNPLVYLAQEPTPEEVQIAIACGRHNGDHTPFHMLAKVALRLYRLAVPVGRMDATYRRARRYVLAAASLAAVNLSAAGVWYLGRVEANAAAQERAAALERSIRVYREDADRKMHELQLDIRELRVELLRLSGKHDQIPPGRLIGPGRSFSYLTPPLKGLVP